MHTLILCATWEIRIFTPGTPIIEQTTRHFKDIVVLCTVYTRTTLPLMYQTEGKLGYQQTKKEPKINDEQTSDKLQKIQVHRYNKKRQDETKDRDMPTPSV
jgi:RsiW-degrading membrane proteinase PrsW (M82 family)